MIADPITVTPGVTNEACEMILHATLGTRGPRLSFGEDEFALVPRADLNAVTTSEAAMRVRDGIHFYEGLEEPPVRVVEANSGSGSSGDGRQAGSGASNEETLRTFARSLTRATPKRTTHTFGNLLPRLTRHVRLNLLRIGYRGFDAQYIARRLLDMSTELRTKVLSSKRDFRARVQEVEHHRRAGSRHTWEQRLQMLEDPDSYLSGGSDDVSSGSSMEGWEDGLSDAQVSLLRNFGDIAVQAELEDRGAASSNGVPSSARAPKWHPGCWWTVVGLRALATWALEGCWQWMPAA